MGGRRNATGGARSTLPAKSGAPATVLQDDRTWSEVEVPRDAAPVAYEMFENKRGERSRGDRLEASLEGGRLAMTEDGVSVSYEMSIAR